MVRAGLRERVFHDCLSLSDENDDGDGKDGSSSKNKVITEQGYRKLKS